MFHAGNAGGGSEHAVSPAAAVRSGQIIVAAFMLGVVMFGGMAVALRSRVKGAGQGGGQGTSGPPAVATADLFGLIAGALLLAAIVALPLLGGLMVRRGRAIVVAAGRASRAEHEAALAQPYQLLTILRACVAETPALLATATVLLTGQAWPLAIAAGALVVMALSFPTLERFDRFVRRCTDAPAVFSIER